MKRGLGALIFAGVAATPSASRGQDPGGRFGDRGVVAVSSDVGLSLVQQDVSDGGASTTTLAIVPAADLFVLPHLSVGALMTLGYMTTSEPPFSPSDLSIAAGARVGYAFPLGERFTFWPKVGLVVGDEHLSASGSENLVSPVTGDLVSLDLQADAPLIWHVAPRFFIGLGPFLKTDLASTLATRGDTNSFPKTTQGGVRLTLGGWIPTRAPSSDVPAGARPPLPPASHFGDPGTVAIASDVDLSATATSISENVESFWKVSVSPGADVFLVRNLSVGGQISYVHTSATLDYVDVTAGSTTPFSVTTSTDSFGIGPRVGYAIRLGETVSLWPRVGGLYEEAVASRTPIGAAKQTKTAVVDLQLDAPLVWAFAPHVFAGLGPFVQTDVSASESIAGVGAPASKTTTAGVKLELGGWVP